MGLRYLHTFWGELYGLSITKPDGSLWISPGFTPQCLDHGTIPATEKAF